ncbi:MAG: hypothetical protein AAGI45_17810 [Cyanobacteria bacterium P01_H01_bin.26]
MTVEFKIKTIDADHVQCQSCGWIGKTEHGLMPPGYGGLLSCPACSSMSIEEYTGPKTVEIPVDLLSAVNTKLIGAMIYLKGDWDEQLKEANRQGISAIWQELMTFMKEEGLLLEGDSEEATP